MVTTTQLIDRIMELSGAMPDAVKHRRYLERLTVHELSGRLEALEISACRQMPLRLEMKSPDASGLSLELTHGNGA